MFVTFVKWQCTYCKALTVNTHGYPMETYCTSRWSLLSSNDTLQKYSPTNTAINANTFRINIWYKWKVNWVTELTFWKTHFGHEYKGSVYLNCFGVFYFPCTPAGHVYSWCFFLVCLFTVRNAAHHWKAFLRKVFWGVKNPSIKVRESLIWMPSLHTMPSSLPTVLCTVLPSLWGLSWKGMNFSPVQDKITHTRTTTCSP